MSLRREWGCSPILRTPRVGGSSRRLAWLPPAAHLQGLLHRTVRSAAAWISGSSRSLVWLRHGAARPGLLQKILVVPRSSCRGRCLRLGLHRPVVWVLRGRHRGLRSCALLQAPHSHSSHSSSRCWNTKRRHCRRRYTRQPCTHCGRSKARCRSAFRIMAFGAKMTRLISFRHSSRIMLMQQSMRPADCLAHST